VAKENVITPTSMIIMANILSATVVIDISPYPTVVIVYIIQ
jgi:hypothetical protein